MDLASESEHPVLHRIYDTALAALQGQYEPRSDDWRGLPDHDPIAGGHRP